MPKLAQAEALHRFKGTQKVIPHGQQSRCLSWNAKIVMQTSERVQQIDAQRSLASAIMHDRQRSATLDSQN